MTANPAMFAVAVLYMTFHLLDHLLAGVKRLYLADGGSLRADSVSMAHVSDLTGVFVLCYKTLLLFSVLYLQE